MRRPSRGTGGRAQAHLDRAGAPPYRAGSGAPGFPAALLVPPVRAGSDRARAALARADARPRRHAGAAPDTHREPPYHVDSGRRDGPSGRGKSQGSPGLGRAGHPPHGHHRSVELGGGGARAFRGNRSGPGAPAATGHFVAERPVRTPARRRTPASATGDMRRAPARDAVPRGPRRGRHRPSSARPRAAAR